MSNKKIPVSREFIEIYRLFNVSDQTKKLETLGKKDLYLLLICCVDYHGVDENNILIKNYSNYEKELKEIIDLQKNEKSDIPELVELIKETGSSYISIDQLTTPSGENIPDPYSKQEIRDIRIEDIVKEEKN